MKKLIASVIVSAAVVTGASAGTPEPAMTTVVDVAVADDGYNGVPSAASSSLLGGGASAATVIAGIVLVGGAIVAATGSK